MQHVDQFLTHYGYFALFGLLMLGIVGPLIPDETMLVFAGVAIRRGQMEPVATFLVAAAGSICGITLSYALGRTGVVYALHRVPFLQKHVGSHLPEAHRWFDRYGKWTLFFGYFVAGARHLTAIVAGTSGLSPASFALHAYPGGLLWVACFLAIGYYVGEGWQKMAGQLDTVAMAAAAAIAVGGLVWWLVKRRKTGE
jgi:membrane protein DedA with SNARE-associated domain